MTLRQIAYLLAVADHGSFTEAARRMHVSQPSLSQQIRSLEAELGGRLLDRPPRPVRLTAAGRAFVTEGRPALTAVRRAADAARTTLEHGAGELRVATVRSLAVSQLPGAIRRWQGSHPGVTVHLNEYAHRDIVGRSVLEGTSELGIAPRPPEWRGVVQRLGWDQFVVVLPHLDPALVATQVPLRSLAGRDWVLFEPGHGLAGIANWAFARAGFEPNGVAYTAQVEAATRLAVAGVGPALVPVKTVPAEFADSVRPLDPPVVWEISAFAAADSWSAQGAELLEVLRGADWEHRRPTGSIQVKLEQA
ncbi:MAG: LysR family transcriptional regulator [Solirubrobacterales bacterium]|nr:LysR family transcriptional regulator [Solirubrobacterales bacterium]